jgi:Family of unknown function (DUF5712)
MPISKPHSTLGADNKGSCKNLTFYLDKENQDIDKLIDKSNSVDEFAQLQSRKQQFFNHNRMDVSCIDVIDTIDNNIKKLGKADAKYFAPTISFSQTELAHIAFKATKKNDIDNVWEMNLDELNNYNTSIREYIRMIMDNYAKNFNRKEKGLNSGADLVYFGKIEHYRKYKGTDKKVLKGNAKTGELKPGLQSHVHIIVSRKDKTQRLKLNPMSNEKSTNRIIGNNPYHVGFDRVNWIISNEKKFDQFFNYSRPELEKFKNQNVLKNGSPKEKEQLSHKINTNQKITPLNNNEITKQLADFNLVSETLNKIIDNNSNFDDFEEDLKKRKKPKRKRI